MALTVFWSLVTGMILIALAFILIPIWRIHRSKEYPPQEADRKATNLLLFEQKIADLQEHHDFYASHITHQEVETEAKKNLLQDLSKDQNTNIN